MKIGISARSFATRRASPDTGSLFDKREDDDECVDAEVPSEESYEDDTDLMECLVKPPSDGHMRLFCNGKKL